MDQTSDKPSTPDMLPEDTPEGPSRREPPLWRRLLPWVVPCLVYAALALGMLAPIYADDVQRIIGGGELGGWLWRYWWMKMEIVALGLEFPNAPLERFLHVLSLGRYPETGNVTDLLAMTIPLDQLLGHPGHYNAKVFLIIFSNALAGYAYALYLTGRRGVALIAGMTLACNVFVIYEFQSSGLRQAILCFLTLFALFLDRTLKEKKTWLGLLMGLTFAATSIFYWFYGLFAALYGLLRVGTHLYSHHLRPRRRLETELLRAFGWGALVALAVILPFTSPYMLSSLIEPGAAKLPEVTWFKSFPSLEALRNVPLRPDTRKDNLLASLARVLYSSWPLDWAWNPLQTRPVPLVMGVMSVGVGLLRFRRVAFWMWIFLLFYMLTWGPYLQYGGEFIHVLGEYTVRLPYWYAFKFIPMMSRLFAPYRMGSLVVLAMMVLLALNLGALSSRLDRFGWLKLLGGTLFVGLYLGQMWVDPMQLKRIGSNALLPLPASEVSVPEWYYQLAKEKGRLGIVELPLERQQDLLNYYQVVHSKKVLGGWADPGAIPPKLRFDKSPNKVGALLQWLSLPDGMERNNFAQALKQLGQSPYSLGPYQASDQTSMVQFGYRYVVLHELGCYLLEPRWGKELYARMKSQLTTALGEPVVEALEHPMSRDEAQLKPYRNGAPWMLSLYSPLLIPEPRPVPLHMVVFRIPEREGEGTTMPTTLETPLKPTEKKGAEFSLDGPVVPKLKP